MKIQLCQQWNKMSRNTKGMKKHEKAIYEKITQSAILSNNDSSDSPTLHIRIGIIKYDYDLIVSIVEKMITQVKLKGMEGISDVSKPNEPSKMILYNEDGSVNKNNKEYTIMAMGNNMYGIRKIKGINMEKTFTNDIKLTRKMFGIEAARSLIIREMQTTTQGVDGGLGDKHIAILADAMCFTGDLISINRNGISKLESGPLSRATFEETTEQFVEAAIFCEKDLTKSVASRIITGKVVTEGTGMCGVEMDMDMLDKIELVEKKEELKSSIKKHGTIKTLLDKKKKKN